MLEGETGVGKSALVRYLAYLTQSPVYWVNLCEQTDPAELIGKYTPTSEKDRFVWVDGALIRAMKEGAWLFLDDLNLASAAILERMNSLLDDDAFITVTEHLGETVTPAEGFRLFAARNPLNYQGRQRLSAAFVNKFIQVYVADQTDEERVEILTRRGLSAPVAKAMVEHAAKLVATLEEEKLSRSRLGGYRFGLRDLVRWGEYITAYASEEGLSTSFGRGAMYVYYDRLEGREARKACFDLLSQANVGEEEFDLEAVLDGRDLAADIKPTVAELFSELTKGVNHWTAGMTTALLRSPREELALEGLRVVATYPVAGEALAKQLVAEVRGRISSGDGFLRQQAISVLSECRPIEKETISALLSCLETDESETVRREAALALARTQVNDDVVVAVVARCLSTEGSWLIAGQLCEVLGKAGRKIPEAISALIDQLKHPEARLRRGGAAKALRELRCSDPRAVDALLAGIPDSSSAADAPHESRSVIEALGHLGQADSRVVEILLRFLGDDKPGLREAAAEALGTLGSCEERIVEALVAGLRDINSRVCESSAYALGKLGQKDDRLLMTLYRLLESEDTAVRAHAAGALRHAIPGDPGREEEALRRLRATQDPEMRSALLRVLSPRPREPVAAQVVDVVLERATSDPEPLVRLAAVGFLRSIACTHIWPGFSAAPAVRALQEAAVRMLHEKVDLLLQRLGEEDDKVRQHVALLLADLACVASPVVDTLLGGLSSADAQERRSAVHALGSAVCGGARMLDALLDRAAGDSDVAVRREAGIALMQNSRPDARVASRLLEAFRREEDPSAKALLLQATAGWGKGETQVRSELLTALASGPVEVRDAACAAASSFSDTSAEMLGALLRIAHSFDEKDFPHPEAGFRALAKLAEADPQVVTLMCDRWYTIGWKHSGYGPYHDFIGYLELDRLSEAARLRLVQTIEKDRTALARRVEPVATDYGGTIARKLKLAKSDEATRSALQRNLRRVLLYVREAAPGARKHTESGARQQVSCSAEAFQQLGSGGGLILTPGTVGRLRSILPAIKLGHPVALVGETGTGKTALVRYLAHSTGHRYVRINLKDMAEVSELVGGYVPTEDGSLVWKDGLLVEGMKSGSWVVLDEANLAGPGVLERLNQLLDRGGYLELQERGEEDGQPIRPHSEFRLFVTMNPTDYAGRTALSPAFVNRFVVKWFDKPTERELVGILTEKYGVSEQVVESVVRLHENVANLAEHRELGRLRSERYVYTLRDLQAVMRRVRDRAEGKGEAETMGEAVSCVRDVYAARLSHQEDRDLFEQQMKVCFPQVPAGGDGRESAGS